MSNSCNPMACSPPGSSVHEISQAITLGWVAISFSRGLSWPRDQTRVSYIAGGFFTTELPGKPPKYTYSPFPCNIWNAMFIFTLIRFSILDRDGGTEKYFYTVTKKTHGVSMIQIENWHQVLVLWKNSLYWKP